MADDKTSKIAEILARDEKDLLEDWLREQKAAVTCSATCYRKRSCACSRANSWRC